MAKRGGRFEVFIAWGGPESERVAKWLKAHIFDPTPGVSAFVSSGMFGKTWARVIEDNLRRAHAGIGIITEESTTRPWPTFELGFLHVKKGGVTLLNFCSKFDQDHPFAIIQQVRARNFEDVIASLCKFEWDNEVCEAVVGRFRQQHMAWEAMLGDALDRAERIARLKLRATLSSVERTVRDLDYGSPVDNSIMTEIASKIIVDLEQSLQALPVNGRIDLHYTRYPEFLAHLQGSMACRVDAVALVDEQEEFWSQTLGARIAETASEDCRRIFVLTDQNNLEEYFKYICQHAIRYAVRILSRSEFVKLCDGTVVNGDFSIIHKPDQDEHLLAVYGTGKPKALRRIVFEASENLISEHSHVFSNLWEHSVPLPADEVHDAFEHASLTRLRLGLTDRIFLRSEKASDDIRHSDVIDIDSYNDYEEDHPFYREMHLAMLRECEHTLGASRALRVLEIGAGTGHFTKRLLGRGWYVVAIDNDLDEYLFIQSRFRRALGKELEIRNVDATDFESPMRFDVVFSSFAEHHIQPQRKKHYFESIAKCMVPDGLFIVGDEFLRDYIEEDSDDYNRAVVDYHEYIIDVAKRSGYYQFVPLEEAALRSGLSQDNQRVDYKTSLSQYKIASERSGFRCITEQCVSGVDKARSVGGMYVLVLARDR